MNRRLILHAFALLFVLTGFSCKRKKDILNTEKPASVPVDSAGKCRLDFKSSRALSRYVRENEFRFTWLLAKANVETLIDQKEESFDIRVNARKDSAMLITIQYLLGVQVAKILITRDSVRFVNYVQKTYFRGDFAYINNLLHTDIDFEVLQAVLVGNSAEFHEDEARLKPVADRVNCVYLLSTARKRRLRRIQQGEVKDALQTLTLNPENFKILKNSFIDPVSNRMFTATYSNFQSKDSVFAPYRVDIDVVAEKKATIKIDYVRIEKNTPQKLTLNIPAKYDQIKLEKK